MNRIKQYVVLILAFVICLLTLPACSAKKGDALQMFSAEYSEEYMTAAKKHFSHVGWSNTKYSDYTDGALEYSHKYNGSIVTMKIGGVSDDTRYVVVISEDEKILNSEPLEGKRYSVFVYDNGSDDIRISMRYSVGTTENCVVKGNVTSGEFAYNNSLDIAASETSDASKRADLIFNALYEALVNIEGK